MSAPADKKIKTWQRAGAVVLALSVWQAASWAVGSALLLPGPVTVLGRLCALAVTSTFRRAVAFSFCRIAGGFALALVLAFVLAEWVGAALPWLMSAAAGCMVCVTAQEMIPQAVEGDEPAGVVSIVLGFALMMALDVAL